MSVQVVAVAPADQQRDEGAPAQVGDEGDLNRVIGKPMGFAEAEQNAVLPGVVIDAQRPQPADIEAQNQPAPQAPDGKQQQPSDDIERFPEDRKFRDILVGPIQAVFSLAIAIWAMVKLGEEDASAVSCSDNGSGACDAGSDGPSVGHAILVILVTPLVAGLLPLGFLVLAAKGWPGYATMFVLQFGWIFTAACGFLTMVIAVNGKRTTSFGYISLFLLGLWVFIYSLYLLVTVNAELACLAFLRCICGKNAANDYSLYKVLLREGSKLALRFYGVMVACACCGTTSLLWALLVLPAAQKSSGPEQFIFVFAVYWGCTACYFFQQTVNFGVVSRVLYQHCSDQAKYTIDSVKVAFKAVGSICFAGLLVALIRTIESIVGRCGGSGCLRCLLAYVGFEMQYFGSWCLVPISQRDMNFIEAGKFVAGLANDGGDRFTGLVQYATTGHVPFNCMLEAAFIGLLLGGLIGYDGGDGGWMDVGMLGLCGFVAGFGPAVAMLSPLQSFTTAILVTWADDRWIVQRFCDELHDTMLTAQSG